VKITTSNIFLNSQQISLNAKQALATGQAVTTTNNLALTAQETAGGITQETSTQQLQSAAQELKEMV
jgi:methyl-accepting chemotaxis protein